MRKKTKRQQGGLLGAGGARALAIDHDLSRIATQIVAA